MNAKEIDEKNKLELLRNPSVDFTGIPNLATQVGAKSIPQILNEFERAGRAIMVARADQNFPQTPGLPLYPDPIEAILLEREVQADLLIARKRVAEDAEKAKKAAEEQAAKNVAELQRIRAAVTAPEKPPVSTPVT